MMTNPNKQIPELTLVEAPCPQCATSNSTAVARGVDYEYNSCTNEFTFVSCNDCGLVYLNPRPAENDMSVVYPNNYYSFATDQENHRRNAIVQLVWDVLEKKRLKHFWKLLGGEPKSILDVGCGRGRLLKLLKKYGCDKWQLTGVEFGLPNDMHIDDITLVSGSYETTKMRDAPYDLIVAEQVIEHAYDPKKMLTKMFREIVPGGYAIIDTPNYNGLDRKVFSKSYWGGYHIPRHLTLFTPATFAAMAQDIGFRVHAVRQLLSPVFWVLSIHNMLRGNGIPPRLLKWIHYQSLPFLCMSTLIEIPNLLLLRMTSNMRIVLRKD